MTTPNVDAVDKLCLGSADCQASTRRGDASMVIKMQASMFSFAIHAENRAFLFCSLACGVALRQRLKLASAVLASIDIQI